MKKKHRSDEQIAVILREVDATKKLLAERDLEVDVMKEIYARSEEPESASSDDDPRERTRPSR